MIYKQKQMGVSTTGRLKAFAHAHGSSIYWAWKYLYMAEVYGTLSSQSSLQGVDCSALVIPSDAGNPHHWWKMSQVPQYAANCYPVSVAEPYCGFHINDPSVLTKEPESDSELDETSTATTVNSTKAIPTGSVGVVVAFPDGTKVNLGKVEVSSNTYGESLLELSSEQAALLGQFFSGPDPCNKHKVDKGRQVLLLAEKDGCVLSVPKGFRTAIV